MIVYDLTCDNGHVFEAWFKDSATFERQAKKNLLTCAVCGSAKVKKALAAPRVGKSKAETAGDAERQASYANDPRLAKAAELMKELAALRRHIEANADYVGSKFAEEARKMHYGESKRRNIYGEATNAEARELADEGIEFARIPWVPKTDA